MPVVRQTYEGVCEKRQACDNAMPGEKSQAVPDRPGRRKSVATIRTGEKMIHQGIGILLIVDGVWSLLTKKNNHWFAGDLGRWVRTLAGVVLLWL